MSAPDDDTSVPPLDLRVALAAARRTRRTTSPAFVNVHIVPMDRETVLRDHTVLVKGDHIVEIGPSASVKAPSAALTIDGAGKYPDSWTRRDARPPHRRRRCIERAASCC
jgi:hypothetical protein